MCPECRQPAPLTHRIYPNIQMQAQQQRAPEPQPEPQAEPQQAPQQARRAQRQQRPQRFLEWYELVGVRVHRRNRHQFGRYLHH